MTQLGMFDLTRVTSRGLSQKWAEARAEAFKKTRFAAIVVEGSDWGPLLLVHPADIESLVESIRHKNRADFRTPGHCGRGEVADKSEAT